MGSDLDGVGVEEEGDGEFGGNFLGRLARLNLEAGVDDGEVAHAALHRRLCIVEADLGLVGAGVAVGEVVHLHYDFGVPGQQQADAIRQSLYSRAGDPAA